MKKKILSILLTSVLVLSLNACSNSDNSEHDSKESFETTEEPSEEDIPSLAKGEFKGYSFLYDSSWETQVSDDEKFFYLYPTNNHADGLVMLSYEHASVGNEHANTAIFAENMTKSDSITEVSYNYETEVSGIYARRVIYTQLINEKEYAIDSYLIANKSEGVMYIGLCTPKDSDNDYIGGFFKVLYTLEYVGTTKSIKDIDTETSEHKAENERLTAEQADEEHITQEQTESERVTADQATQEQTQLDEQKNAEEAAVQTQTPQETMVWIPNSGSKYHSNASCSGMNNPSQVTISQAQASGYEPCKKCY